MSDKHAPGPWTMTVYPPDNYGAEDQCAYIDDGNGKHVAHCLPPSENNNQLRDANARLISAAPELLQALRTIAAITTCADQDQDAMCAEIQGICRVALAKVTGGAA